MTARLTDGLPFPYLLLLVSGGHCELLSVNGPGQYTRYGGTLDDAVGEAFDKTAKLLGLSYPGGPAVEQAARRGNATRFSFPRPMLGRDDCDFSFSGLKTAVVRTIRNLPDKTLSDTDVADAAASFQAAVADVLVDRAHHAIDRFRREHGNSGALVVAGGVAANAALRESLAALAQDSGFRFVAPPPALCTDNAAMIAWAGIERLRLGLTDGLDFAPRPRWPLDEPRRKKAS